ncbi:alpha/beta fold hydrolase [Paracraurococcus lichenis]|uniref:Alpha/beta fold hydrolase n=1 Tax=Paracraurococcus lichenis TaxID=3064888 RepID=A0ABT9DUI2_9PROT|nr:alpha/beta fold hydrolase [Paracraurococcus sp. LOR1-02]MDO9707561.1 alpha/beta fold hydrolase [Paracraurococcus sp. LOR1-02]
MSPTLFRRLRRLFLLGAPLLALLTAACTPVLIPAGPPVTTPAVAGDALVMRDGARLPLRRWLPEGPPRAILLGLHGFNDAARNFMEEAAPAFTAAGVAVYAYDQRGFGAAPHPGIFAGGPSLAADASEAARLIRARHPGVPLVLLGESMGGAVLVLSATSADPPPADGYILMAPAFWGREDMPPVMRWGLWLASRTIPLVGFPGTAGGIVASDNEEALRRWGRDPLTIKITRVDAASGLVDLMDAAVAEVPECCRTALHPGAAPVLVLLGAKDRIIPTRVARRVVRGMRDDQQESVAYYEEGWHLLLRDHQRAVVARDILAWMAAPAAPLPSGADLAARDWLAKEEAKAAGR